ncbi:hypothetical protein K491DRAFT_24591 [Lophiostoma macrostomum CBS 122681]|uniref:Uncharacterized protein n=1 Tax=Lophiostoma macrostomum CBS 122681 TaxID=1314788 RepID=A0A6A6T2B3_9PLEO|nr:hypothetical protein K491DRAFT_24591 [Lophiostoma macrostomum CBS 122681]
MDCRLHPSIRFGKVQVQSYMSFPCGSRSSILAPLAAALVLCFLAYCTQPRREDGGPMASLGDRSLWRFRSTVCSALTTLNLRACFCSCWCLEEPPPCSSSSPTSSPRIELLQVVKHRDGRLPSLSGGAMYASLVCTVAALRKEVPAFISSDTAGFARSPASSRCGSPVPDGTRTRPQALLNRLLRAFLP